MNKEKLVALIMANTDEFKKTHLMLKPIAEVREIAAQYLPKEEPVEAETAPDTVETVESPASAEISTEEETPQETPAETATVKAKDKAKVLNDTQKILLETLPLLPDFKDGTSIVTGKSLLDKVNELHNIPPRKTGPVMVALKRKEYFKLVGKKSGQKILTVQLLPLGAQYLGLKV